MMIRGGKPLFFKDRATANYENSIIALAAAHKPAHPIEGPVGIKLTLVLSRPQALCRKKDPRGLILAPKRPDWDNLVKGLQDQLSKLGFWRDDGQITDAKVEKRYAEIDGAARIEIEIWEPAHVPELTDTLL